MSLSRLMWAQNAGQIYNAIDMRQMAQFLIDALGPQDPAGHRFNMVAPFGALVTPSQAMQVTQRGAGANMSVDVLNGVGLVRGQIEDAQGTYVVVSSGVNVAIAAAHASLDRTDSIYLVISDDAEDSSGLNQADMLAVTGTPGGGVPANPYTAKAGAMLLANVSVPHASSSVINSRITDLRVQLGQAHAAIVNRSAAFAVNNVTTTYVVMDGAPYDPLALSGFSTGGDAHDVNLSPGLWEFTTKIEWQAFPAGIRRTVLDIGGTPVVIASQVADPAAAANDIVNATYQHYIPTATTVQLGGYQNSGTGTILMETAYLYAKRLGA